MSIIKKTLFSIILFSTLCCSKDNDQVATEESIIISIMIDELTANLDLAYELGDKKNEELVLDSLRSLKVNIFVDPIMRNMDQKLLLPSQFQELQNLADSIFKLPKKKINRNLIITKKNIKITFDNDLRNFKEKFPQKLFFSRIAFDKKLKTAVLFAGNSFGKLQSYTNFYILKKNNEKWEIVYEQKVEIS